MAAGNAAFIAAQPSHPAATDNAQAPATLPTVLPIPATLLSCNHIVGNISPLVVNVEVSTSLPNSLAPHCTVFFANHSIGLPTTFCHTSDTH